MGTILTLKDNQPHVILCLQDLFDLMDETMGPEMVRAVQEEMTEIEMCHLDDDAWIRELEEENQKQKAHWKEVMKELREIADALACEIRKPRQNRIEISRLAGKIGNITRRELR